MIITVSSDILFLSLYSLFFFWFCLMYHGEMRLLLLGNQ